MLRVTIRIRLLKLISNTVYMWVLRGSYVWGLFICVGQEDREGADQILGRISV